MFRKLGKMTSAMLLVASFVSLALLGYPAVPYIVVDTQSKTGVSYLTTTIKSTLGSAPGYYPYSYRYSYSYTMLSTVAQTEFRSLLAVFGTNPLILISGVFILVLLSLSLRTIRLSVRSIGGRKVRPKTIQLCQTCGWPNPAENGYCGKCGASFEEQTRIY